MSKVRATIVHISDLHFGGGIDHQLQPQLKRLIKSLSPQFLIVSGDLAENPFPSPLREACRYIDEIANECGIPPERTLVIPGNHDYKIKGNFGFGRLTRIPFEVYFRREGLAMSRWRRFLTYSGLVLNSLCLYEVERIYSGTKLQNELTVKYDEHYGVAMFGFNSTPLFEMGATGEVGGDQISGLTSELIQEEGPSLFTANSILDWARFLDSLREPTASTPQHRIRELLRAASKKIIEDYSAGRPIDRDSKYIVVKDINEIVKRRDFYTKEVFEKFEMSKQAQHLLRKPTEQLSDEETERLNRLLLEAVYPVEIAKRKAWGQYFKLAVVHHHPIPIPYASTSFVARIEESFMVFYNAGAFLRELGRHGCDLILHGHKHFAGFTRVTYDLPDRSRTEIGVLAAGSATHRAPSDWLGNEFNVIRIYDDGTTDIEQWYYAAGVLRKDESRTYGLCSFERLRERRNVMARRRRGITIRRLRKIVRLTHYGYSEIEVHLEGCQVCGKDGLECYPILLETKRPAYTREPRILKLKNGPKFPTLRIDDARSHLRRLDCLIDFGELRRTEDGQFDIGYSYRLMSGHALSLAEFQRKYAGQGLEWEYASVTGDEVVDAFKLTVEFPEDFPMETLNPPGAEVYYIPNFGQELSDAQQHHEATSLIRDQAQLNGKCLELEVISPITDFIYRIRWNYVAPEQRTSQSKRVRQGVLRCARERLIGMARDAMKGPSPSPAYQGTVELLTAVLEDVMEKYPRTEPHENLDISLLVFDDEHSVLRFVVTNTGPITDLFQETFVPGEGCAGFSFEKNSVVFYDRAVSANTWHYITPDEITKERRGSTALIQHEVLITIPWIDDETGITVGVIAIGSMSKCSRLLHIFDIQEVQQKEEENRLINLTKTLGLAILGFVNKVNGR